MLVRRLPPTYVKPQAGGVAVWQLNIARCYQHIDLFSRLLSRDERERAYQLLFERDRANFTIVRGALRLILGRYLGEPPESVCFAYGRQRKPSLMASADNKLQFNVSHSGQRALIAITYDRAVGIDLEHLRRLPDLEQLIGYCCTPQEQNILAALTPAARRRTFFNFWTAKEAYIKARGTGMALPLSSIDLSIHATRAIGFRTLAEDRTEDRTDERQGASCWTLVPINAGRNYSGNLVTGGPVTSLDYYDWQLTGIKR